MTLFRILLIAFFACMLLYTGVAIANDGWNLVPIFFGDISALNWSGQFNLDFLGYLLLSGLWVSWRNRFSVTALALSLVAMTFGLLFFAPYLLYLSFKTQGDIRKILLGDRLA